MSILFFRSQQQIQESFSQTIETGLTAETIPRQVTAIIRDNRVLRTDMAEPNSREPPGLPVAQMIQGIAFTARLGKVVPNQ